MTTFDFSPLYRSAIGFDRLFNLLDSASQGSDSGSGYPPYNIELTGDDEYRITMAVAGFAEDDLELTTDRNTLIVTGKRESKEEGRNFVHRGIAERAFERRFQLADYVEVRDASLVNGLLHIDLRRELPDAMKPRQIAINSGEKKGALLEGKSKAA